MRISVVGTSCSGKTTLGRALAERWGLRCHDLDDLFWRPGWETAPPQEFRAAVDVATSGERWIVTGNYSLVRDTVWARATHVVWLDYSFTVTFARALKRTLVRIYTQESVCNGNKESLKMAFFHRESILLWVLRTWRKNRRRYGEAMADPRWAHITFIRLRNQEDADAFLRTDSA